MPLRSLRLPILVLTVLVVGCGLETPNRCPDGNGLIRKSVVNLRDAEIHLMLGNAFLVFGKPDEIYPVIQTSASAQTALDAAFVEMNHRSIDSGIALAEIRGAVVICIPSGDIGIKLDTLSVSHLRHLDDAEMKRAIENGIEAQELKPSPLLPPALPPHDPAR